MLEFIQGGWELKENLKKDINSFSFDIGVVLRSNFTLQTPNLGELELVKQEIGSHKLIEDSYSMKIAEENLELARYNRDQVYDDKDADKFDREQADLAVEKEEIEIKELKRDAEQTITKLYSDIRSQYNSIDNAKRELQYAKEDIEEMKKRYEAGVISKDDYELSKINVTQAEKMLQLEMYQYYLLTEQAELLETGVILID